MSRVSRVASSPRRDKSGSLSTMFSGCRSQDPANVKMPQVAQARSYVDWSDVDRSNVDWTNVDRSTTVEDEPRSSKTKV